MINHFKMSVKNQTFNDVWVAPLSAPRTWAQLSPSGTPPASRTQQAAIYDAANGRLIVFGGLSDAGPLNDVWALFLNGPPTWIELTPAGDAPPFSERHRQYFHSPAEIRDSLAGAGFDVASVNEEYSDRPVADTTLRATWIARLR